MSVKQIANGSIWSVETANNSKECIDTMDELVAGLKNWIEFGEAEADEEELKQKYDARIRAKLEAGKPLTSKEMQYLRKNNPGLYVQVVRIEAKRRSVEAGVKSAKSKQEVEDIQFEAMSSISDKDPARKYMVAAVQDTIKEFKKTQAYRSLPEEKVEEREKMSVVYEYGKDAYQLAYMDADMEESRGFMASS